MRASSGSTAERSTGASRASVPDSGPPCAVTRFSSPTRRLADVNRGYGSGHEEGARTLRGLRVITVVVPALVMIALFRGCSGGSSKPSLAEQDQLVGFANQLDAIHSQWAATQRRLVQARRAVARVRT